MPTDPTPICAAFECGMPPAGAIVPSGHPENGPILCRSHLAVKAVDLIAEGRSFLYTPVALTVDAREVLVLA